MAGEKVRLLDPHEVEVEVAAEHVAVMQTLGWVRAPEAEREKKEPARRAKILPAPAEEAEEEEPPPKSKARRD